MIIVAMIHLMDFYFFVTFRLDTSTVSMELPTSFVVGKDWSLMSPKAIAWSPRQFQKLSERNAKIHSWAANVQLDCLCKNGFLCSCTLLHRYIVLSFRSNRCPYKKFMIWYLIPAFHFVIYYNLAEMKFSFFIAYEDKLKPKKTEQTTARHSDDSVRFQ
jgi:hypothetical protein